MGWIGFVPRFLKADYAEVLGLPRREHMIVFQVVPDFPGQQAGLLPGDIILSLGGEDARTMRDCRRLVLKRTGTEAELVVLRAGKGGFESLVAALTIAAEAGNARAAGLIGTLYDRSSVLLGDDAAARRWYRKAIEGGDSEPVVRLARFPEDRAWLLEITRALAEKGDAGAMYGLAMMYEGGLGVTADRDAAFEWHLRAAEKGHAMATLNVGIAYDGGFGVARDQNQAFRWYKKAADAGEKTAMENLVSLQQAKIRVDQHDAESLRYLTMAATTGHTPSMIRLGFFLDRSTQWKNSEAAAKWMFEAALALDLEAHRLLTAPHVTWSDEFRRAVQRQLAEIGLRGGPIDGVFDQTTLDAIFVLAEPLKTSTKAAR